MATVSTGIEWTDATWNPVRGCALVSPGCTNCYAMRVAHRFSGAGKPFAGLTRTRERNGPVWTGEARFVPEALAEPLSWRSPRKVFVNSMSDLFHEDLTNEQIAAVFGVMAAARQHTFQVLTKRADRMRLWFEWLECESRSDPVGMLHTCAAEYLPDAGDEAEEFAHDEAILAADWPLPNVWLGVSVEDQARAYERVNWLLATPARVRFLSLEPLLGPVDLEGYVDRVPEPWDMSPTVDWVIVGGESGPGARPMDLAWARSIVRQCREAAVPVFVKQLGARPHDSGLVPLRSRKGGDPDEWPADLRVREFPEAAAPPPGLPGID